MTQATYIVVVGAMAPPVSGSRWVGQGPRRDPIHQSLLLQCDSKKIATEAVKAFHAVGLFAEMHESYAAARMDQDFRELE